MIIGLLLFGGMRAGLAQTQPAARFEAASASAGDGSRDDRRHDHSRTGAVTSAAAERTVVVHAAAEHAAPLRDLIASLLQPQVPHVDVISSRSLATDSEPLLILELEAKDSAVWLLRVRFQGRSWVRRLPGPARDAAALEGAAAVFTRAAAALLQSEVAAVSNRDLRHWIPDEEAGSSVLPQTSQQGPSPPSQKAPRKQPSAPGASADVRVPSVSLLVGLAYRPQYYAARLPFSQGAYLSGTVRDSRGPCGRLSAGVYPATTVETDLGSFDVARFPLQLDVGYCFRRGRIGVAPFVGALLEPTVRSGTEGSSGVGSEPDSTFWGWGARTMLAVHFEFLDPFALQLGVGIDALLRNQIFLAEGQDEPLLSPANFRPFLELGVAVSPF